MEKPKVISISRRHAPTEGRDNLAPLKDQIHAASCRFGELLSEFKTLSLDFSRDVSPDKWRKSDKRLRRMEETYKEMKTLFSHTRELLPQLDAAEALKKGQAPW